MQHTNTPLTGGKNASVNRAWGNASLVIGKMIATTLKDVQQEVAARAYRASNELRNASLYVLRGQRTGRRYKIPATFRRQRDKASGKMKNGRYYSASAPSEAPAVRTGILRLSWGTHVHVSKNGTHFRAVSAIESNVKVGRYLLGDLLEDGTDTMKPRPYKEAVKARAMPKIEALYKKSFKK